MIKSVVFYNHFHNGDLHVSRQIVRKIAEKLSDKYDFYYTHVNNESILKDIPIKYSKNLIKNTKAKGADFILDDKLYISTWYGASNFKYLHKYGTSFNCLYHSLDDVCQRRFNFSLKEFGEPESLISKIDFSKCDIQDIDSFLSKHTNKRVLVCNNLVDSGQAKNFPMYPAINQISKKYPHIDFMITNYEKGSKISSHNNIYYLPELIKIKPDLNEIAYLSTFCNMIIGRYSGPYTFSLIQENLMKDIKYLCFMNGPNPL